jgi:hypothetical protein
VLKAVAFSLKDNELSVVSEPVNHGGAHLVVSEEALHLENSKFVVMTRLLGYNHLE